MEKEDEAPRGNLLDDMPPINCDVMLDTVYGSSKDIGDTTFCLGNYIPDFMKVNHPNTALYVLFVIEAY